MQDLARKYRLTAYGITKDILGGRSTEFEMPAELSVGEFRQFLYERFPRLRDLRSLFIAVNNEYADDGVLLRYNDDIALIPPVSGG